MSPLLDWLVENEPSFRRSRLPSLFSDLTVQKTSNPEGYAANVAAWSAALTRAAVAGKLSLELDGRQGKNDVFVLRTGEDLVRALASQTYGTPTGLGNVLDDCVGQGRYIDLRDFEVSEASIYAKRGGWIPSPWTLVSWGLRQAGLSWGSQSYELSGGKVRQGRLVLVPVLEEVWKRIQPLLEQRGQGLPDRVEGRDTFVKEVSRILAQGENEGNASLSEQDVQILLRYLARDKQILSYDGTTVKFKSPTSPSSSPEAITQEDHSIASLKSLIANLQDQTTTLSTRLTTLQIAATSAVKQGNKPSALSALRSKKLVERTLQQRLDTLAQLEEIYTKIESAVSQVEVLQAMESSAATLKTLNKRIGGVERVEDVLESLREEVGKVDEVSDVLADPGAVDQKALLDEDAVDEELETMEREEKEKVRKIEEEATRKRLQELDALERIRQQTEREKQRTEKESEAVQTALHQSQDVPRTESDDRHLEDALSSSIEKLRALDLDTSVAESRQDMEQRDQRPKQQEQKQNQIESRRREAVAESIS